MSENQLLSNIETLISSKLSSFEQRMMDSQKQISQAQISKIQENLSLGDKYTFRKKGNQEQHKVNSHVLDKLREADGFLKDVNNIDTSEPLQAAQRKISEGIEILAHRQKLIKLADSSESGWRAVQEYETHPLADDSEDEKKIYRAQMKAERKLQQERKARARRFVPYRFFNNVDTSSSTQTTTKGYGGQAQTTSSRKPGTCFRCGRPGHWRSECKAVIAKGRLVNKENQISSFSVCSIEEKFRFSKKKDENNKIITPVNRLHDRLDHWRNAGANAYLLDVVKNGYKLPFRSVPAAKVLKNNRSAYDNPAFVESEIMSLLEKKCISEVSSKPSIVNPLTVAYGKSDLRLPETIDQQLEGSESVFNDLPCKKANFLLQSKSDSTNKKYFHYFLKWEEFITAHGATSLPASPIHVALYLTSLMDSQVSYGIISTTVYSIKWVHSLKNLPDPTGNSFVRNLLEASKRILSKPVVKKEHISTELLLSLCEKYVDSSEIMIVKDLCMILIAFSGFLRFDELSHIRCNDIIFHDNHFSLFIRKSKTDHQYRHGNEVVISKGTTVACPYEMLKRYMLLADMSICQYKYLFRPCFKSKAVCKLIYKDKPLSYTCTRECLLARLREVAGDLNIGLHSLRAGGATIAANAGVNDRCWKRHGRWKAENSKDGYVADSLESPMKTYSSVDTGDLTKIDCCAAPKQVCFKRECPVILTVNISQELVNGLRGIVRVLNRMF